MSSQAESGTENSLNLNVSCPRPRFSSIFPAPSRELGQRKIDLVDFFDLAAVVAALTALLGYLNHRIWRLPAGTGIFALSLFGSLGLMALNALGPQWHLQAGVARFLGRIDFTAALMHGMLSFLLFAGALQVDLERLRANRGTVLSLATVGVVISTVLIGLVAWLLFQRLEFHVPLLVCFVLGALISPTDPIAVLALLKRLDAPRDLEAQIAGESLFNDGVGVVLFFALLSVAGLGGDAPHPHLAFDAGGLAFFLLWEVGGGLILGLLAGGLVFLALRTVEDSALELLLTLAMVMLMYSVSFPLGVSGPIAVVVAGLLIGSYGRRFAMSARTAGHVDAFWNMMDEILNAALFLLLGLQVIVIDWSQRLLVAGLCLIPLVLAIRFVSVGLPLLFHRLNTRFPRGIVPVLTWGGLRGSLSVAMVLSLPTFAFRDLLVGCTYLVMLFSVLVQGTTMHRLLTYYGIGGAAVPPEKV